MWSNGLTVAFDSSSNTSVVAECLRLNNSDPGFSGTAVRGTLVSATKVNWEVLWQIPCRNIALDPHNKDHFIYSNVTLVVNNTFRSTDGGATFKTLNHPSAAFYVGIDSAGWFYTAAEAGAFRSIDNGASWQPYVVHMATRANFTVDRIPHDYQRIVMDYGGGGVAFPSDQGLFIKPNDISTSLINACGNLSNNIAIKVAVSEGNGPGERFLVTTMWDWGPVASWNSGKNWPGVGDYWDPGFIPNTPPAPSPLPPPPPPPPGVSTVQVVLQNKHNSSCTRHFSSFFWVPHDTVDQLNMTLDCHPNRCGSVAVNGGENFTVESINPHDDSDVCGHCNCSLAFISLVNGPGTSGLNDYTPGETVKLSYSPFSAPSPPPAPPSPPSPRNSSGSPGALGEGGAAWALGKSNHVIMLHFNNIWYSAQGGQNTTRINVLPQKANSHSSKLVYDRMQGSRVEPSGTVYTVMSLPSTYSHPSHNNNESNLPHHRDQSPTSHANGGLGDNGNDDGDDDDDKGDDDDGFLAYMTYGEIRDETKDHPWLNHNAYTSSHQRKDVGGTTGEWLLKSDDFGLSWNWTQFPSYLHQTAFVTVDPSTPGVLYATAVNCISKSTDKGVSWGPCLSAPGLSGAFSSLEIKDASTWLVLRNNDVPLRTQDGGKTFTPLSSCAPVSNSTWTRAATYSWSGNTVVMYGRDVTAPLRGERGMYVWSSTNDGDTWTDETDDLATISPCAGVWFDTDFYLSSSGEGIVVKRNLEQ
eukprot:m.26396 g.26396  ORF g.26396 m.26396 type:complete len:751 (+) comp6302_c0_seq1:567-2819(+)